MSGAAGPEEGAGAAGRGATEPGSGDQSVLFIPAHGCVTQTKDMRWMCIEQIFQKLHIPGDYKIGWTYTDGTKDYCFFIRTERFSNNYLMHLSVCNKCNKSFTVAVSGTTEIRNDTVKKNHYMGPPSPAEWKINRDFKNIPEDTFNYLNTYCFSSYDVERMEGNQLIIAARIYDNNKATMTSFSERVKMCHKFDTLLRDPIFSDFTIESADGERFPAHKMILSAHSEVFKAMLKDDTAESQNNMVKLIDAGKEDVECLLQFMYTGSVENILTRDCRNLLMLADRYDLPGLSALAQYALRRQVNVDNALELAAIADMYNASILESALFKFIKENPKVLVSENWKQLRDPDLMNKIFQFLVTSGKNLF